MQKLLLIETGGTIGSTVKNGVIDLCKDSAFFAAEQGERIRMDRVSPYKILSENLAPACFPPLLEAVRTGISAGYTGIIITHGSDTLAYTSAMVGLCFPNTPVPIVLTAANKPPEQPDSNAAVNLQGAMVLLQQGVPFVYTVYSNDNVCCTVYAATRLRSADALTDSFSGVGQALARIHGTSFTVTDKPLWQAIQQGHLTALPLALPAALHRKVLMIVPYPGLDYTSFAPENYAAVLHCCYHSATACISGNATSAEKFVQRAYAARLPVYLAPLKMRNKQPLPVYTTTAQLLEAGALPLYNISYEAAYCKLLLAYNQDTYDPYEWMKTDLNFEYNL